MTGSVVCRWCGARVLSDQALAEHYTRCKRRPGWDEHVDDALKVAAKEGPC